MTQEPTHTTCGYTTLALPFLEAKGMMSYGWGVQEKINQK